MKLWVVEERDKRGVWRPCWGTTPGTGAITQPKRTLADAIVRTFRAIEPHARFRARRYDRRER